MGGLAFSIRGMAKATRILRCRAIRGGEASHLTSTEKGGEVVASQAGISDSSLAEASGIPKRETTAPFT
jgi:hypothetical protein